MEGTFEVFARHQPGSAVERRTRLALLEDGEPVLLGPGEEWWFDLAIPPDIVPAAAHVLVFKGRLGLEEEAVVGQVFTVPYVEVRQTSYDADLAPVVRAAAAIGRVAALSHRRHRDHPSSNPCGASGASSTTESAGRSRPTRGPIPRPASANR